jgi:ribosome biogenesis protein Tsr3
VADGSVVFENPWAEHALTEGHLRSLLSTHRCRLDFSWHRAGGTFEEFQSEVERELCRLEWLFSAAARS